MMPARRSEIRRAGREARRNIVGEHRAVAERALIVHVASLHQVVRANSVGVFVAHDGEPDLGPLIDTLWGRGQAVALPVVADRGDHDSMWFRRWHQGEELEPGRFDIPVPPESPTIVPETLLVSFTGFDGSGNRIGRGGGFFDRYLADYEGHAIGVGFEAQRFDLVPMADHDIALPVVVTDLGVRFFR